MDEIVKFLVDIFPEIMTDNGDVNWKYIIATLSTTLMGISGAAWLYFWNVAPLEWIKHRWHAWRHLKRKNKSGIRIVLTALEGDKMETGQRPGRNFIVEAINENLSNLNTKVFDLEEFDRVFRPIVSTKKESEKLKGKVAIWAKRTDADIFIYGSRNHINNRLSLYAVHRSSTSVNEYQSSIVVNDLPFDHSVLEELFVPSGREELKNEIEDLRTQLQTLIGLRISEIFRHMSVPWHKQKRENIERYYNTLSKIVSVIKTQKIIKDDDVKQSVLNSLAVAAQLLAERTGHEKAAENAIQARHSYLLDCDKSKDPQQWVNAVVELAKARYSVAQIDPETMDYIRDAWLIVGEEIEARSKESLRPNIADNDWFELALLACDTDAGPEDLAQTILKRAEEIGNANLSARARLRLARKMLSNADQIDGVEPYEKVLELLKTLDNASDDSTRNFLSLSELKMYTNIKSTAHIIMARHYGDDIRQSAQEYAKALEVLDHVMATSSSRKDSPLVWAEAASDHASALAESAPTLAFSRSLPVLGLMREALNKAKNAAETIERKIAPRRWAVAQQHLGFCCLVVGKSENESQTLHNGAKFYFHSLKIFKRKTDDSWWATGMSRAGLCLSSAAKLNSDKSLAKRGLCRAELVNKDRTKNGRNDQWSTETLMQCLEDLGECKLIYGAIAEDRFEVTHCIGVLEEAYLLADRSQDAIATRNINRLMDEAIQIKKELANSKKLISAEM